MDQVIGKLAPDQFLEERLRPRRAGLHRPPSGMPDLARADFAIGQVLRQTRCGKLRRKVPPRRVALHRTVQKPVQLVVRRARPHRLIGQHHCGPPPHRGTHGPVAKPVTGGPDRGRAQRRRRRRRQRHRPVPHGLPERREDLVEPAAARGHLPRLEQHMPRITLRRDSRLLQRRLHAGISRHRRRFVPPGPDDPSSPGLGDQTLQRLQRRTPPQHQTAPDPRERFGKPLHRQAQPPLRGGAQCIGLGVKNEQRDQGPPCRQSRLHHRMVVQPQIPTEPEYQGRVRHQLRSAFNCYETVTLTDHSFFVHTYPQG